MPHFTYLNPHSYWQVLRVTDSFGFYLERVVAPMQTIEFDAVSPDTKVEMITGEFVTALVSDHFSCAKLEQVEA